MNIKKYSLFLSVICLSFFVCSCKTSKKVTYFRNIPDSLSTPMAIQKTPFEEPKIKVGDVLNITIQTIDPRSADMITGSNATNAPITTVSTASGNSGIGGSGYLVDQNGYIEIPLVGRIKVADITVTQVRDLIHEKATQYYTDPIVNVRNNIVISILGDVTRPGTYTIPNDKVSVLDAIGLAGDLSITGKRENILLLREGENNQMIASRYNLNSTDIFQSPYYYLRSGDKLYIEPNKARKKGATTDFTQDRYLTYAVSLLTLFLAVSSKFGF